MHSIGIMQGRLVAPVGERIQAFPTRDWRDEFRRAQDAGLAAIEWIFDIGEDGNPIATDTGLAEMSALSAAHGVAVRSLCADYFMPEPLLKGTPSEREQRVGKLAWLLRRCAKAGIQRAVLPFVDNSKLDSDTEITALVALLSSVIRAGEHHGVELHLETSLPPSRFATLLRELDHPAVKVNYDSGNSASLGFDADEEFAAYGERIGSVHIKDRVLAGSTVPLGSGAADFPKLMRNLRRVRYAGEFVLQVARGTVGDEVTWTRHNREFLQNLLTAYF
jgi:hexulose-6-phosphate isomerase